ncbi:M81 family metallopeptidase [Caenispirillum bisanense]|uniref:M81 family metallopeptidase n=1 Tax=Caenispirillum bisanense TaxID=414052 RepID=UPI0031D4D281
MTFHVLAAMFGHETNVFSRIPTTRRNFEDSIFLRDDAVLPRLGATSTEFSGLAEAAAEFGWSVRTPLAAWATPGGRVEEDTFDTCAGIIADACRDALARGQLDGILLFLHGAMSTTGHDDAEGRLLTRLREVVPAGVPIAVTLDLHANVTPEMCRGADILCAYRTYPHIDQAETARRAAGLLHRAMRREISPRLMLARAPTLTGLDDGRTTAEGPMTAALRMADAAEASGDGGVLCVSLQAGFIHSVLPEAGPSVVLTCDGEQPDQAAIADRFVRHIWDTRAYNSCTFLSPQEAMERVAARRAAPIDGPIVVADYSDNPGGGAYGDATRLLEAVLAADIGRCAYGTLYDPEAVRTLWPVPEGETATLAIGGKIDPAFGPPLTVTGTVVRKTDGTFVGGGPRWKGVRMNFGDTVVFRVGAVDILICSKRVQCTEIETFTHAGIAPAALDVVVVKSMQHFRAAFAPLASEILVVDAGALCSETRRPPGAPGTVEAARP